MKKFVLSFLMAITFSGVSHADEMGDMDVAGVKFVLQNYPGVATANDGMSKRAALAKAKGTLGCFLTQTSFYRHGNPNRGGLTCKIYLENKQWYVQAEGPTHEPNTSSGAASASCQAMCLIVK